MFEIEDFVECGPCGALLFPGDLAVLVNSDVVCASCVERLHIKIAVLYH